jgi:hypothetical protein|tara:strand:- start:431 stop:574 length:144 start_codon:yes stop_codon:yes gene_type:complete
VSTTSIPLTTLANGTKLFPSSLALLSTKFRKSSAVLFVAVGGFVAVS